MDFIYLMAAAIGFAPPIILMLLTLQRYTYPVVERPYFSDPKLFGLFAVGIVLGIVLFAVSAFVPGYALIGFLVEEALKLVLLNMPRFHRRADTPFYGFGLGAGMGAAFSFGVVNMALINAGATAEGVALMCMFSAMTSLLSISTAVTIGMGVARSKPFTFFAQAAAARFVAVILLAPITLMDVGDAVAVTCYALALAFAAGYYWWLFRKTFPEYVREALSSIDTKGGRRARKIRRSER